MSSEVVFIHSYPGAADTLKLLWPGFKKLGRAMIGVDCVDEPTQWPEKINTVGIGRNKFWMDDPYNLPIRLIETLAYFLCSNFDRAIILEYDTLITRKPAEFPDGLVTHRAGGQLPGCIMGQFFSTPWIVDRMAAVQLIRAGDRLLDKRIPLLPHMGSPDVFLAACAEAAEMPYIESGTFSANTIEGDFVEPARRAFRDPDCWLLHGVKTESQLKAITDDAPTPA